MKLILTVVAFLLMINTDVFSQVNTQDSIALVKFYNSTHGNWWTNNTNWLSKPIENWHGITVTNGRVTGITLSNNSLLGTIPIELGALDSLQYLYLNSNRLSGTIPMELGNLNNLQNLSLDRNELSGAIPIELGNLNNLQSLILSNNQLSGTIPMELGNLTNLQWLLLSNNRLYGTIPVELGNLTALQELFLDRNELSGDIPEEIGNLNNLTLLFLNYNQFTSLPDLSSSFPFGFNFQVSYNFLDFNDIVPNVSTLYAYTPQNLNTTNILITLQDGVADTLDATIPGDENTYQWFKDGNLLSGQDNAQLIFPVAHITDIGTYMCEIKNPNAPRLTLQSNTFQVNIDLPQADSLALVALYQSTNGDNWVNNNNWLSTQPISLWYGVTVNENGRVINIELISNNLSARLPPELGNLGYLNSLVLSQNPSLTGEIPDQIGSLINLKLLDLSNNGLTGNIPETLADISELEILKLQGNHLESLPDLTPLTALDTFDVKNNQLTFEDLEPNESIVTSYSPQTLVLRDTSIAYATGYPMILEASLGGDSSHYQWYKDDMIITGADSIALIISQPHKSDSGVYYCEIHNSLLPDLTLTTGNIEINIEDQKADSLALATLYNATNGDEWYNNTNWLKNSSLGSWHGISLSNGRVSKIEFHSNNLSGKIPVELGNLTSLQELYLAGNPLSWEMPVELRKLEKLKALYIIGNPLPGEIPAEIGLLRNLEVLHIYSNHLSGEIPAELGNLNNLKHLWAHWSQLSGEIPESLGDLDNLLSLNLIGNQLTGEIPEELGNLSNLTELIINSNQLSGEIPKSLGNLSRLKFMSLEDNRLSGEIPKVLGNIDSLLDLRLKNNQLIGEIPERLGNVSNLRYLDLSHNQLSGGIPESFGNLNKIIELHLDHNSLTGKIHESFGNLTNLKKLIFDHNQLEGEIPESLGNLSKLKFMSLESNQLTGKIPESLGKLDDLIDLNLQDNQLTGEIPASMGDFDRLENLRLYNNQLSGEIPAELGKNKRVKYIYLYNNRLTGEIPSELADLRWLQKLDISHNQLTALPMMPSSLSSIDSFVVHDNKLQFGDLESNTFIQNLFYNPQDSVPGAPSQQVEEGNAVHLGINVTGMYNRYQWYKNDSLIQGAISDSLTLSNVSQTDAGVYHCEITNDSVPQLTLYSQESVITILDKKEPVMGINIDSLSFQTVAVNDSVTLGFEIINTGDTTLTISSIEYPDSFKGNYENGTILPDSSLAVMVTFTPLLPQMYDGAIIVISNGGQDTILVNGEGEIVMAVEPYAKNSEILLYPNYSKDEIHINSRRHQLKDPIIYDLTGQKQRLKNLKFDENRQSISIDIKHLPEGMYYLNILCGSKRETIKFLIQRQ